MKWTKDNLEEAAIKWFSVREKEKGEKVVAIKWFSVKEKENKKKR